MTDDVDVFMDVDGVLNVLTPVDAAPAWGWGSTYRTRVHAQVWSPELIHQINQFSQQPHVHMHWLTTWMERSKRFCRRTGLRGKDWPVVGKVEFFEDDWWKLHAIRNYTNDRTNRIVWIDDDLMDEEARQWAATLGERILLVQPDTFKGVTKDEWEEVVRWVG